MSDTDRHIRTFLESIIEEYGVPFSIAQISMIVRMVNESKMVSIMKF